jgi:hypothetical protein
MFAFFSVFCGLCIFQFRLFNPSTILHTPRLFKNDIVNRFEKIFKIRG